MRESVVRYAVTRQPRMPKPGHGRDSRKVRRWSQPCATSRLAGFGATGERWNWWAAGGADSSERTLRCASLLRNEGQPPRCSHGFGASGRRNSGSSWFIYAGAAAAVLWLLRGLGSTDFSSVSRSSVVGRRAFVHGGGDEVSGGGGATELPCLVAVRVPNLLTAASLRCWPGSLHRPRRRTSTLRSAASPGALAPDARPPSSPPAAYLAGPRATAGT